MSDSRRKEIKVFVEMEKLMTPDIILKLQNAINFPSHIRETTKNNPIKLLYALKDWEQFDPSRFDLALQNIGGSILHTARKLEWLSSPVYKRPVKQRETRDMKGFVQLLSDEMTSRDWSLVSGSTQEGDSKEMLKLCVNKGLITSDMSEFCAYLEDMERVDLVVKVRNYLQTFHSMGKTKFSEQLKKEVGEDTEGFLEDWHSELKKFVLKENKEVSVILDQEKENIESVYIPLTIVKQKILREKEGIESGIVEINFLRTMHKKVAHKTVEVVNFDEIVLSCNPLKNKMWVMVGSPGSGKTFLCKHFAFLYGTGSLINFRYTISMACRNEEWHKLEEARYKSGQTVNTEFIITWLILGMSTDAQWSKSLSQHLVISKGEGLFIIIDGADEFTRNVPFQKTLLCQLLERRIFSLSTILLTSRPAAWSEILYSHGTNFKIDSNFQVLGFSPQSRDVYFEKRIETPKKLSSVREMFYRHDEINQLALVPVNASLFCAMFNQSDDILSQTLTHLYTQLIVYIIRRQLSRLNLKEQSKVKVLHRFHPSIIECINTIAIEANQGIFERKLTSDKDIILKIGDKRCDSERLGLMHSHFKELGFGKHVKVWVFQHLTIQEYLAAFSICNNSWRNQCYIIRYLTASTRYFAMYKMVIRVVYGLLRHNAGCITPILCRHALPKPMSFSKVPMKHQLYYDTDLVEVSKWVEFTQSYLQLSTLIIETNSRTISDHFRYINGQNAFPFYLYFLFTVAPNDWYCFIRSLKYIQQIPILVIHSEFVSAVQFNSLLTQKTSCYISYLALVFVEKDFDTVRSFTRLLSALPHNTKISLSLESCDLSACPPTYHLIKGINQLAGSLNLSYSKREQQMLLGLSNRFSLLENLYYSPNPDYSHWSIISQLVASHSVRGLCIEDFSTSDTVPNAIISSLTSLTELHVHQHNDTCELIPFLCHLTSLTVLILLSHQPPTTNTTVKNVLNFFKRKNLRKSLKHLIRSNSNSLKELRLDHLEKIEFHSWSSYSRCIISCTNLIVLELYDTEFNLYDINCWYKVLSYLRLLAYLSLGNIPLQDRGMLVLCHGFLTHPAIRRLRVLSCELSSSSCVPLMCLIQTLKFFMILDISASELSSPDPRQFQLLTQTAEESSAKIKLFK